MHKKWTRQNSHKLWIYSHNKLLVGGNNLSGFKNLLGAWLWHWWSLLQRAWAQERPGEPSFAALSTSQQDPTPSAYLFAEAVFDTQTELRKTVVKILIKKHCGFFSYAVAWEGVGCCPSYWKICGMFATDVYQVFSLSKKERRERQDDWKARWKICKWSLIFPTSHNIKKTIQGRDLSLPNIKYFNGTKTPTSSF